MSTIADYSVFTKAFLASGMTDFSKLYGTMPGINPDGSGSDIEGFRAFAVIPFNLQTPLTPREAMNFDRSKLVLNSASMARRVSCRDANGNFIGNIVRVQPNKRDGSIRFVAKVAVPGFVTSESENNPADAPYNTFVLVRTDACTNMDLPIAVATISKGYNLHKHKVVVTNVNEQFDVNFDDPLDDVENANYVSFTINHLNGYTSVDFNPDAYATYDDVANALSRSIDGLHIAFDTASGDLKLLDKDGNVLDQANLPIKTDVIIADGEEGYKYVKTDVKQDIHAAKAWMPGGFTAWEAVPAVDYEVKKAALVVEQISNPASRVFVESGTDTKHTISKEPVTVAHVEISGSTYMVADIRPGLCSLFKIKGDSETCLYQDCKYSGENVALNADGSQHPISNVPVEEVDVIKIGGNTYVLGNTEPQKFQPLTLSGERYGNTGTIETREGSSTDRVLGITTDGTNLYTFDEGAQPHAEIFNISGKEVRWLDVKTLPESPAPTLKYGLEAFVWTVKDRKVKLNDPFFQQLNASLLALGFHEGDDIALGTNLAILAPTEGVSPLNKVDANDYMHGKTNKAKREQEVDTQRANAKEELVAWNKQHPALEANRGQGTIIDSSGLDVRNGSITLGCGRVGEAGVYGIQMNNSSESLDFTISHTTGNVQFDDNGHAANLTRSTLLSVEAGSYISGAPTCLILAKVTRKPKDGSIQDGSTDPLEGSPVLTPVRMTAGFSVEPSYNASSGLNLTIHDDRENISAVFVGPNNNTIESSPAIIEVQAIYTHPAASSETVPAQQMHTYIGSWVHGNPRSCSFLCNKIEEWMTAIDLADTSTVPEVFPGEVGLYVVIRVY